MELTNIQQGKVNELLFLYNPSNKVKVDFKAPTGSGKTLMATTFISELIEQNPSDKFVFVIATPSSSSLPLFFEQKINQYKTELGFSNFFAEYIKSPSDAKTDKNEYIPKILPEQNKVFIFGKSSFGKGRILSTFHIVDDFVEVIKEQNYKLVYIRDEAHIGGKLATDEESKNFERLMQEAAFYVFKMTATPDYRDTTIQRVVLNEEELNNPSKNENKYLLKTNPITLLNGAMTDDDMLLDAIKTFKKVKEKYKSLESSEVYIRPALLIQVDNDSSTDKEKSNLFFETFEKIKKELSNNGISWVKYFGDGDKDSDRVFKDKFTLAEITDKDSDIDAIIFKIGPATGWDIPRACMLLQLRNVCSQSFNLQTIGRIKRNCYPELEKNDVTDKYYIYSNAPVEKNVFVFNAKIKEEFANEEFMSIEITNEKDCSQKVAEERLKKDINEYLENEKSNFIQEIKAMIVKDDNGNIFYKKIYQVTAGGARISRYDNVYIFIKEILKLIRSNQDAFDNCENLFNKFWKDNLKNKKLYADVPLIKEFFYLVLIEKHITNIRNLINKNRQYKPKYEVKSLPYKPPEYVELYSSENHKETLLSQEYLFETEYGGVKNSIPVGQNETSPEVFVFKKLEYMLKGENVKVWGKNFTSSNVNGAYLDKYNKLCHSYFDFVVKFNNDAFLYIEVKSEHDIDPEKTKTLQGAYEEYFNKSYNLFDKPVVIGIWKVDTSGGNIKQKSFYDKAKFSENLDGETPESLIKIISSKKYHKF
ncbi:MAG: DEAD/DEAH box helicase family protein [Chitinispirillales bacterium]|jgi:type III restriction enzyme|nr:DEAD/DEAH box helicase family protein [Chitinispirillales bacterium]